MFAEVTQEVHEADASTARLVGERRIVKLHSGSGDWLVHVSSTVRLKNFMPALPDVVAALPQGERTHWRNGWVAFKGRASPDQARVMFVPHDDMIFANAPDGDLGEHLADIVSELARRPDNASKLGGGNSALVVHTHQSKAARAVQHVLHGGGAPNVRLPPACDHAIVLAGMIPAGFVSFSRGTGWRGHTFLQVSLPALEQTIRARWRLTRVIARRTAVWRRLLGVPEALASECGSLCHGDGAQGRAPASPRQVMLAIPD